ncbi:unnamed protein product [Medioppia subpectinata]|uniref:Prefoldin subunit 5 n=1 Tax=Medioppia subpectinata TaxID=1979941 RepID=A0A7R9KTG4_9ACAR|nr:unnamed protein product [Medioppia subpectinata]CAG2109158.1 unnamed protein product [Medioppia subpectinata]
MANKERRVDLNEMNSQQLLQIKQQLEAEVEILETSVQSLQNAKIKFNESSLAVDRQKDVPKGSQILVPLTGSMYVPAVIEDNNEFVVDIGTGIMQVFLWFRRLLMKFAFQVKEPLV